MHRLGYVTSFRSAPHVAAKLDELATEAWDPEAADLDLRSTRELVALMNAQDATVPDAVAGAADAIAAAIDAIAGRLAGAAAGSSTSARERRAGSRSSTPPSASRRSPRPPASSPR